MERIRVKAYSGSRGEEKPRSFILGDIEMNVEEIMEARLNEDSDSGRRTREFKVRCSDGLVYRLSYDEALKQWSLFR